MDASVCLANRITLEHSYANIPHYYVEIKDPLEILPEDINSLKSEIDVDIAVKGEDYSTTINNENSSDNLPSTSGFVSNQCFSSEMTDGWENVEPKIESMVIESLVNKIDSEQETVPKHVFLKCKSDYESAFEQMEKEKNALDERILALQVLLEKSKEEKGALRTDVGKLKKIIISMTTKEMELRKTLHNRELEDKYNSIAFLKKQLNAAKLEMERLRRKPEENLTLATTVREVRETKRQVKELQRLLYTERKLSMTHSWQMEVRIKKINRKLLEAQRVTAKLRQSLASRQAMSASKEKELLLYKGRVEQLTAEVKELSARVITAMSKDLDL